MTKVMVFGTFDHLHQGHLYVFEQAQKRGDVYVVVARDTNVEHIKGRSPDATAVERMEAIKKAVPNAHVQLGDTSDYLQPVHEVQPDIILLGYDQKFPPSVEQDQLPCKVERLEAFKPELYKTSIMRAKKGKY